MNWTDVIAAVRTIIEDAYSTLPLQADMPLAWENEYGEYNGSFIAVSIEGVTADKTMYGSAGKRSSIMTGIVFVNAFVPTGTGTALAAAAVETITQLIELQVVGAIRLEGGAPPSPVEYGKRDNDLSSGQPGGQYWRCSGSVPFIVIGTA